MLKRFFSWLNNVIPKRNIILFNSFPFYSDNAKSVYEYILKYRSDILNKYRVYWISDERFDKNTISNDIRIIRKKSLRGIWLFLHAKYIFATHGYFKDVFSPSCQFNVNLWHGCGYKGNSNAEKGYRGNYNIVTSELYVPIHSDLFAIPTNQVLVTGLPRNDDIFNSPKGYKALGIDIQSFNKVILWLPTYRKASIGHEGVDGNIGLYGYRQFIKNCYGINDILKKKNFYLVLKLHPLENYLEEDNLNQYSNIRVIRNEELKKNSVSIYELFCETDALISDYSSVLTDYMLTGNAIAYVTGDFEEYKNNRGFVFDDISKVIVGPILHNENEFEHYLDNFDSVNDLYRGKRDSIRKLFHKYIDGNSTQRVVEYFFGKDIHYVE